MVFARFGEHTSLPLMYPHVLRVSVVLSALEEGVKSSAERHYMNVEFVKYWVRKFNDPTYHPDSHGGRRYASFSEAEQEYIEVLLWLEATRDPIQTLTSF